MWTEGSEIRIFYNESLVKKAERWHKKLSFSMEPSNICKAPDYQRFTPTKIASLGIESPMLALIRTSLRFMNGQAT